MEQLTYGKGVGGQSYSGDAIGAPGLGFGVGATTGGPVSNKTGRGRQDYSAASLRCSLGGDSGKFNSRIWWRTEAPKKGTAASVAAFKAKEVDDIRPTFYDGKLGIKGQEELIEQYKIDFAKRLKFPKGGSEYKKQLH